MFDKPYIKFYNSNPQDTGKLTVGMKWDKNALYIGRGSKLGNPFVMKDKSEEERTRVLRLYEDWLRGQIKKNTYDVMYELNRIADLLVAGHDVHLGCYCKHPKNPKRCHGDIIKKVLFQLTYEELDYIPF